MKCDILIVGAGLAGLVMAERISSILGRHCLVIDKRDHIGGNCYDYTDKAGVLVHKYGPHVFYSNSEKIVDYLGKFTHWILYQHRAGSYVDGKLWSFPINLNTFEQLLGRSSTSEEMIAYFKRVREPIANPSNSEEAIVSQVGWELYEKFYKGYTTKQWNHHPKELDASICAKIPIRTTRNDLYFDDKYQCMPHDGYTSMFYRMVENNNISVLLNTPYKKEDFQYNHLVYTGILDEYFGYVYGRLPYRALRFEHESFGPDKLTNGFYQPLAHINYPGPEPYTRISEMKHATGQKCLNSTIIREYPSAHDDTPYYPVLTQESITSYSRYKQMADECTNITFVGRLPAFRNYSMSQTVGAALSTFEKLQI